ncbi:hypothetical protein [Sporosarcina sp. ITBMC105]
MSAIDKPLVLAQNRPAPQYYNRTYDRYEVIEGRDGANSFIEKGRTIFDTYSGSTSVVRNYSEKAFGFAITNDGLADLTFMIHGLTITVKPGETFDDLFEPFTSVQVTATDDYRLVVRV